MMEAEEPQQGPTNPLIRCSHSAKVNPRLLKPHTNNPNRHPEKQLELFISILHYQGWRRPITVSNRSGMITKGHGAWESAMRAGFTIVPVEYQDYDDEDQEIADIIADNQLQRMSEMDNGKLTQLLVQLDQGGMTTLEMTALPTQNIQQMLSTVPGYGKPSNSGMSVDYEGDGMLEDRIEDQSAYAQETIPSGGPAVDQPYDETVAKQKPEKPQSDVRMIQLFFTQETVAEFMTLAEHFQKLLNISNTSDVVLEVLRLAKANSE